MCSISSTSELPNGILAPTHSTLRASKRMLVGSSIQIAYETMAQQSRPRRGHGEQEASPPAPARSGSLAPTLAARLKAGERIRSTRRVSRLRRIAHAGTSALTGTVRHVLQRSLGRRGCAVGTARPKRSPPPITALLACSENALIDLAGVATPTRMHRARAIAGVVAFVPTGRCGQRYWQARKRQAETSRPGNRTQ